MAATLHEIESRVSALENEARELRALLANGARHPAQPMWADARARLQQQSAETPADRGARMLAIAEANRGVNSAQLRQMLNELGINGEPIGAENVQAMMLAEGVRPEDCILSREIIAMREE